MLPELEHEMKKSNVYINEMVTMAQSIYCHLGWNQELMEYVFVSLIHSIDKKTEDVYIEFIYLLEEALYTTKTCDDFADFLVMCCRESMTSLKYMCVILQKTLVILQRSVAT